jgi:hypothetical protein
MSVCFCTLAITAPYRQCARTLCAEPACGPWVVLTDEPDDFADLPVRAIYHQPTGPTALDYIKRLGPTGQDRGAAAAYHDKRFAVQAALEVHNTAIFLDADSMLCGGVPHINVFPPGLAVLPLLGDSVAAHLDTWGAWRFPAFEELANDLMKDSAILHQARWCHEACYAVTKDGNESRFFWAWEHSANFLQRRGIISGEGGVMALAAAYAGWTRNDTALAPLLPFIQHQGGGPKEA